jgi:uncharacterized protein DUF1064
LKRSRRWTEDDLAVIRRGAPTPAPVAPKYGNRKVEIDDVTFDSHAEARRYQDLLLLARANEIGGLEIHPRIDIVIGGVLICTYIADFRYVVCATGNTVVEDVKSGHTRTLPVYRLKRKLVKAVLGIEIVEVM